MNIKNKIPIHANLGLIFLEFLIGNYISIFINTGSKGSFMYYLSSYPIIAIHAMLGGLIFIISLVLVGLTFKSGKKLLALGVYIDASCDNYECTSNVVVEGKIMKYFFTVMRNLLSQNFNFEINEYLVL